MTLNANNGGLTTARKEPGRHAALQRPAPANKQLLTHREHSITPADLLLSRLDAVKRTGDGRWIARCPAHGDRHPSLAVRELSDGRLLVYCHAGCAVGEVLAAVGLSLADLFSKPITHRAPRERRPFLPADVFEIARLEIGVAAVIAADMHAGREISESDYERLFTAAGRLAQIAEVAYGARG